LLAILIVTVLSACASATPAPTATSVPNIAPTETSAPTIAPTATATSIPSPQEWKGSTIDLNGANSQTWSIYIDQVNGTTFTGRTSYTQYGDINAMEGQYIQDFGDETQQAKWSYFEDYKNGNLSGAWIKFHETKVLQNASGGANISGVYYAHIQSDGTMVGFFFESDDASAKIPSYKIKLTLVQPAAAAASFPTVVPSNLHSGSGATQVTLEITNDSSVTLKVFWVDQDGNEKPYGDIASGKTFTQGTYSTDAWRVKDAAGNLLLEYVMTEKTTQTIVFAANSTVSTPAP
jgi:hypothetical protein